MKINISTKITGSRVLLMPYRIHHVPKYHEWMSKEEIRELTSSEPLSLDEEYAMQQTWQHDDDKLTFIVIRRDLYEQSLKISSDVVAAETTAMIGDVNGFLSQTDNGDIQMELEVMIVDKENRGKGYGKEAITMLIAYCIQRLNCELFIVKIDETNKPSIGMFEKMGFVKYEYLKVFKQISLKLDLKKSDTGADNQLHVTQQYSHIQLDIDENYH